MSHQIGAIVNFELNKQNAAKQCSFRFRFEFISNKSFVNKRMKIATKSEPQRAKIYKTSISCLPFLFRCGMPMRCTMFGRRRYLIDGTVFIFTFRSTRSLLETVAAHFKMNLNLVKI